MVSRSSMTLFKGDSEKVSFQISLKEVKKDDVVMSFGRLFQISGAAALKALAPAPVLTQGNVRRLWSAERSDRPVWYNEMSDARYIGWLVEWTLNVNYAILKSIQHFISSQCNSLSVGLMWSWRCTPVTTRVRVFCIIWSFNMFLLVTVNSTELA